MSVQARKAISEALVLAGVVSRQDVARVAVDVVVEEIVRLTLEQRRLEIRGLGVLKVVPWSTRHGRNPKTGRPMRTGTFDTVRFKPGKVLKRRLRGGVA